MVTHARRASLSGAWAGRLEYAVGGGLQTWSVTVKPDGSFAFGDEAAGLPQPFTPTSRRLQQPDVPLSLGHCGLFSAIDVDGSFWDPVGLIDADPCEAINCADGFFTLLAPDHATFRTPSGFALGLRRHVGPKNFQGCA